MADLKVNFAGIESPNPFWLASAPPTNMGSMVERAFDAGWGGAVWKTLGEPIVNVCSRLASLDNGPSRMIGLNNIELITDRPLEVNLKEIRDCKRSLPEHIKELQPVRPERRVVGVDRDLVEKGVHGGAEFRQGLHCRPKVLAPDMLARLGLGPLHGLEQRPLLRQPALGDQP